MNNYKVKELFEDELYDLKDELRKNLKRTIFIYGAIDLRLRKGQLKTSKLRVYQAEDSKFKTFVFIAPIFSDGNLQSMSATWDLTEVDEHVAGCLLSNVPGWKWNEEFFSVFATWELKQTFQKILEKGAIDANTTGMKEILRSGKGVILRIAKEDIHVPKLPKEYNVGPIPSSAIPLMLSTWKFAIGESAKGLIERLETYKGKAIYYNNPKGEERSIVAWTQQYMFGAIGMTFTLPEHRNKGLGTVVTLMIAKQVLDGGEDAYVLVEGDNKISKNFHSKIGFKEFGDFWDLFYVPST